MICKIPFVMKSNINSSEIGSMSIPFENETQRTIILDLLKSTDDTYLVRTPDGKKVEFGHDIVEGVIIYD